MPPLPAHYSPSPSSDPHLPFVVQVNLAGCLHDQGLNARAREHYQRAVALDPGSFIAHGNFAMFLQTMHSARPETGTATGIAAVDHFRCALRLQSDWADGHYNLANLLSELGPEHEAEAIEAYRAALALEPDNVDAHTNVRPRAPACSPLHPCTPD